jgi:hypothetical protein
VEISGITISAMEAERNALCPAAFLVCLVSMQQPHIPGAEPTRSEANAFRFSGEKGPTTSYSRVPSAWPATSLASNPAGSHLPVGHKNELALNLLTATYHVL